MRALLIFTTILALTAVGCAGSDGKAAAGGAPLTAEQYEELERLSRAQLAVERLQEDGKDRKAVEAAASACADVPEGDPLLDTVVEVCDESIDALSSMLEIAEGGCRGRRCVEIGRETMATIDGLIATARRGDEHLADLVPDEACRDALVTPPEVYEAFGLMSETFAHLDDALRTEEPGALEKATSKLEEGEARFEDVPSARQLLERFRAACSA